MRHLEKLWTILFKIDEARAITPQGKPCRINAKDTIYRIVNPQDTAYIFEKLEQDEKVIKLVSTPPLTEIDEATRFNDSEIDCYVFNVLPEFDDYFDSIYTQYSFGADKISDGNLIKVLDVALDIKEELELTNTNQVTFRLSPNIIKFPGLMPADTIGLRDDYMNYRYTSLEFLKRIGAITHFDVDQGMHRWDSMVTVDVKRLDFDRFYEKIAERYESTIGKAKDKVIKLMSRPEFKNMDSKIVFNGKECPVAPATVQFYVCEMAFADFGNKIPETDIIEKSGKKETKNIIYDAHRLLNKKIEETLNIKDLFEYAAAHVWIRKELFLEQ